MDEWAWEELRPWLELRVQLPVGPLFCVINGPTRGRHWASAAARAELRRTGARRRFAPHQLRAAHAVELAREGVPLIVIQRQLGHSKPRHHLDLPAGHQHHAEIIETVHARRAPMIAVNTSLRLLIECRSPAPLFAQSSAQQSTEPTAAGRPWRALAGSRLGTLALSRQPELAVSG